MTTEPSRANRRRNESSLFGPVGHGRYGHIPTTVRDDASQHALFEKQQRTLERADLSQSHRYEVRPSA